MMYFCELCQSFFGESEYINWESLLTMHDCYRRNEYWANPLDRKRAYAAAEEKRAWVKDDMASKKIGKNTNFDIFDKLKFGPGTKQLTPDHDYLFVHEHFASQRAQDFVIPTHAATDLTNTPLPGNDTKTYGDGGCMLCNSHGGHPIGESAVTRNAANMFYNYLVNTRGKKPDGKGVMLGVAHRQGTTTLYLAISKKDADNLLDERFMFKVTGWTIKCYMDEEADITKTRRGRAIPDDLQKFAVVSVGEEGQRTTATCAASKLVIGFIQGGNLTQWNMTEMTLGTFPSAKYVTGTAAVSCKGCEDYLPCLLCDQLK